MGFRNLIFQTEVVEQRFGAVGLPHHDQQSSENENPAQHVEVLPCFRQISPANLSDFFNTHACLRQLRLRCLHFSAPAPLATAPLQLKSSLHSHLVQLVGG